MAVDTRVNLDDGEHIVQFYESEGEIVHAAGAYVASAVDAGHVAIVLATAAHRAGFEAFMSEHGIDVGRARRDQLLVMLDAETTLEQFVVDGQPDPAAFDRVVGRLVRAAEAGGRKVRAYGEMVAVMWDRGNVTGAIELERLWNDLGAQVPFSLFCSYPAALVATGDRREFEAVCSLHTSVVEDRGDDVVVHFDLDPASPRDARHFVASTLRSWARDDLVDDAAIVVTELATNAVVHAGSAFSVSLTRRAGNGVRITVTDASAVPPTVQAPTSEKLSGRGMALVDALAARWGCDRDAYGKGVWAELTG